MNQDLSSAFEKLDKDGILSAVKRRLAAGEDPARILDDCRACVWAMIGRYDRREIYIDALVELGKIGSAAAEALCGALPDEKCGYIGKIVCCTVFNDVHQAGRLMTAALLRAAGFKVFDLGSDVQPEKVIEALRETGAPILALSGLVSSCIEPMRITVEKVRAAGLRPKILVGGGLAGPYLMEYARADAFARDLAETVHICKGWADGNSN
jgi:methanogenic corrinoid protein MtbC1